MTTMGEPGEFDRSFVITTYGGESAHTQKCLGRIRQWKTKRDEVILIVHDESPILRQFLELCRALRIIDRLVLAPPGHGHVRGVNLGVEPARAEVVFNICIDMRIGAEVVTECEQLLRSRPNVGMVAWHYNWSANTEGSQWKDGQLEFSLRKRDDYSEGAMLAAEEVNNIRNAPWSTGRVLGSAGTVRITCANGSFFAIGRELWNRMGGFDERLYPGHFADDFLTYAILDQGLDVLNIPRRFRCGAAPDEFLALTELPWLNRPDPDEGVDRIQWTCAEPAAELSEDENVFLDMLARSTGRNAVVSSVGQTPWPASTPENAATRYDDISQVPESDVIACAAPAPRADLVGRLRPGGVLVAFGCEEEDTAAAGEQRLDSLRIVRHDGPRQRFRRAGT
jgi:GT2 family glycosyltransferase